MLVNVIIISKMNYYTRSDGFFCTRFLFLCRREGYSRFIEVYSFKCFGGGCELKYNVKKEHHWCTEKKTKPTRHDQSVWYDYDFFYRPMLWLRNNHILSIVHDVFVNISIIMTVYEVNMWIYQTWKSFGRWKQEK